MSNDIELLKQDFLRYLNFLVFPSPEILIKKISSILQKNALRKIVIKNDNKQILFIGHKNKIKYECHLTKSDLGEFGLSLKDFREGIKDIKNKDSKKILSQAIEEVINLHNKKLFEIYVSSAILVFTEFYEKFKCVNSKEKNSDEIYDLIIKDCIDTIPEDDISRMLYNLLSFIRAYQYPHLDPTQLLDGISFNQDFTTKDTCLNTVNAVKTIQLTLYRGTYINLINSIEELTSLQVKDKNAINDLTTNLKNLTNNCFLHLIQTTFYEGTEKFTREKEITKNFRDDCQKLIEIYQNGHPDEFKKQRSILDKILWLIGKLIPSPILPKEKKISLFGNKAITNTKKITEINSQVKQLAVSNYFSRILPNR